MRVLRKGTIRLCLWVPSGPSQMKQLISFACWTSFMMVTVSTHRVCHFSRAWQVLWLSRASTPIAWAHHVDLQLQKQTKAPKWVPGFLKNIDLFIWLCRVSGVARWMLCCGIWNLVTWLGIEPGPLHWEHWILATGPPGKSQLIGFSSLSLTLWVLRMWIKNRLIRDFPGGQWLRPRAPDVGTQVQSWVSELECTFHNEDRRCWVPQLRPGAAKSISEF